jgi:hypothetical protein
LQAIEPATRGLEKLLVAFDAMVQRQLDHPSVNRDNYSSGPKSGWTINVPKALLGDPSRIVVAYGEAAYRDPVSSDSISQETPRPPLYWVAQRLGTSDVFARAIQLDVKLTRSFLAHLELSNQSFSDAISLDTFRDDWSEFVRDDDLLAVYNIGTALLLENAKADFLPTTILKAINFDQQKKFRTLCEFIKSQQLACQPALPELGRAGKRLANAVALVNHVRSVATS